MYHHRTNTRRKLLSRYIACILAVLMLLQNIPVYAEESWSEIVSDPIGFSSYNTVTFKAGEEISSVFVTDGGKLESFPEVAVPEGKKLLGWYEGNTAVNEDTEVTSDLQIRAVFTTVDSALEAKKASAKYKDTKEGTYATVSVFGNNHKGHELKIKVNTEVLGGTVLEAWTVDSIQNKSDLTLEAVITALPSEGILSAYTVIDDQIVRKVAEDLAIGDRVSFDLSRKGAKGIALVLEEEKDELLVEDNALWANDEVYLTGQLPANGIVVAEPLTVEIEGEKVISAYSIQIYANEKQREKGKTWHPADKKVQVHFYNDAFSDNMNVYYVGNHGAERIDTVDAVDGWVKFEADDFFAYAITRTIETVILASDGRNYRISVTYTTDMDIPSDAELSVSEILGTEELYEDYALKTRNALGMENDSTDYIRLFDISIIDKEGKKIEPASGSKFDVSIELTNSKSEEASVVHFADENGSGSVVDAKFDGQTVSFETEDFNVYAVVYTVDFEYSVNGNVYQFILPEDGYITLHKLLEELNINEETNGAGIDQFAADIEDVKFSAPELVWVGKTEEDTTIEQLKTAHGLECEYSAGLSDEHIQKINAATVSAGEWILISLKPFTSEETMTVIMKDGEVFAIRVTDAQIKKTFISDSGETWEIIVEYGDEAEIASTAELRVREILPEDESYQGYYQAAAEKTGAVTEAADNEKVESSENEGSDAASNLTAEGQKSETGTSLAAEMIYARFFDIEIWNNGMKIEPAAPVSVFVKLAGAPYDIAPVTVLHFSETSLEVMEPVEIAETDIAEDIDAATVIKFEASEFSVYGMVWARTADADVAGKIGRTIIDNVVIYENHNSLSTEVTTIPEKGTRVTLLGTANSIVGGQFTRWYSIEYTDDTGAVFTGFVEQDKIEIVNVIETEPVDYETFIATMSFEEGMLPEGVSLAVDAVPMDEKTAKSYRALAEAQMIVGDESKGIRGLITAIEYFDLSVLYDGVKVQPSGEVRISLTMKTPIVLSEGETLRVIHFTDEDITAAVLSENKVELTVDENDAITHVSFVTDGFSTYALAKVIEKNYIARDGNLYHITVTYGENTMIPEGATLEVTEFEEKSQEFLNAWKVLTGEDYFSDGNSEEFEEDTVTDSDDTLATTVTDANTEVEEAISQEKAVSFETEGVVQIDGPIKTYPARMAALDITIYDAEGQVVEPQASVLVSIVMKVLPEDAETEELDSTLAIHHLKESEEGTTVDTVLSVVNDALGEVTMREDSLLAEFDVDSFSTYTITWGKAKNTTTNLRLRENNSNRAQITVHYVDENGNPITRPTGINANTDQTVSWSNNRYTYNITTDNIARAISGYTYKGAHSGSYNGTEISSVTLTRTSGRYGYNYSINVDSIYLVYSGSGDITVHYGYMNGGSFVEFGTDEDGDVPAGITVPAPSGYGDQWDLEKNIPGFRYVTTRLNDPKNGRQISSLLNADPPYVANTNNTFENADQSAHPSYNSSTAPTSFESEWRYRQLSSINWNPTGDHWNYSSTELVTGLGVTKPVSFVESDKDIYVIYERGSMNGGSGDGDDTDLEDLNAPATDKQVDSNQDGTYDITLSVKGEKKNEESSSKANVVLVLDTSWSMYGKDAGNGKSRFEVAKSAIGSLADKLFALNAKESDTIELAFVNFAQRVRNEEQMQTIYSGTNATSFKNMINGLDCASGTNWDDALSAADHIYFNDNDPTYVVFITDGDPISCAHPYGIYTDWDGGTYYNGRSNYEYALAAKHQADLIIRHNKTLYTIGAFGEIANLQAIGGTYLGQANDSDTINGYFDGIIADIQSVLGYEAVTIHDGITALTSTTLVNGTVDQFRYIVTKDGVEKEYQNGAALQADYPGIGLAAFDSANKTVNWNLGDNYTLEDGVTYAVKFTVWPIQQAYDLLADFGNGIKDITRQGDDVKKQFLVSVESSMYQYVTGKGWTTDMPVKDTSTFISDDGMRALISSANGSASFYLRTNTSSTLDYTSVKTVNGQATERNTVTGSEIKDPNGKMILAGTNIQMEKVWNDSLDPSQLLELLTNNLNADKTDTTYTVKLHLWQDKDSNAEKEVVTSGYSDGFIIKPNVVIKEGEVVSAIWPKINVSIAPGVMVKSTTEKERIYSDTTKYPRVKYGNETYIILESGHSYMMTEDDTDLHFEMNSDVYHPMVVDGKLRTVKFGVDENGSQIITEMSQDGEVMTTLTASNDLKGGLDVKKYVTTQDDASDTVTTDETFFTFKIKLQKSQTDTTPVYTTPDQFDENGKTISGSLGFRVFAAPVIPADATDINEDKSSYIFNGLTYNANRNNAGEIVSYTARGTIPATGEITLKIRQSMLGGADNLLDRIRIVNLPAGTYYTVTETEVPTGYEILKSEAVSGVAKSNIQPTAIYWNKRTSFSIDLLKVDESDNTQTIPGAEFVLYKEDGSTLATDAEGETIGTIKTGEDGKAQIGKLPAGTYKLVETVAPKGYILMTSPITVTVTNEKVTFQQDSNEPIDAEKSSDGLTWTITASNVAGHELPSTGGPGTALFTILGILPILGAGELLMRRRRRM